MSMSRSQLTQPSQIFWCLKNEIKIQGRCSSKTEHKSKAKKKVNNQAKNVSINSVVSIIALITRNFAMEFLALFDGRSWLSFSIFC